MAEADPRKQKEAQKEKSSTEEFIIGDPENAASTEPQFLHPPSQSPAKVYAFCKSLL